MKVAIVGGGPKWYDAPFDRKGWECWGLNATWRNFNEPEKKFARWIELHRRSFLLWEHGKIYKQEQENPHFQWLRSLRTLPVYVQTLKDWPDLKTARLFPFKEVAKIAPPFARYHACSIDWMVALAIHEGAKEIALYGVEQDHTGEPYGSRACVEFWSGVATGRGIHVWSADGSTFRCAQLTYRDEPYALDPAWLPWRDGSRRDTTLARKLAELTDVIRNGS